MTISVSKSSKFHLVGYFLIFLLTGSFFIALFPVREVSAAEPILLTQKWTGSVAGGGESLLVADIRSGYPGEEVVHCGGQVQPSSTPGRVTVLNGRTGETIQSVQIYGVGDTCQAQMADVDNDGLLEIIVPLQQPAGLYILNSEDLSVLWSAPGSSGGHTGYFNNPTGGRVDSSPVIGDVDNDGYADIFVGIMAYATTPANGAIRHLEYQPGQGIVQRGLRVVWHPCAGGLSLADTDNDGTWELYMADRSQGGMTDGDWGRGLRSFWADNLTSRWDVYDNMMSSNIPMIADVNHDGVLDIVATDLSNAALVLDSSTGQPLVNDDGTVLRASFRNQRWNHYQSSVYDIDGDGNLELMSGDGFEGSSDYVTVLDLWDWQLDATIDTTLVGTVPTRSWKGPTVGEVTGDGVMDLLVTTFEYEGTSNQGMVQVYDIYGNGAYELVAYTANNLRHRAIDTVVQDVDRNDGGLNEMLVLTQGGVIYCFDTPGLSEESQGRQRARSEVQFYSERRNGAAVYVPYEYDELPKSDSRASVLFPSPSHWEYGVSTSISELSFTLNHPLGEQMDYVVTCTPNVITGPTTGTNVGNGVQTVPVSGLTPSTTYVWQVVVTDDSGHITSKEYAFTTENSEPTQGTPTLTGYSQLDNIVCTPHSTYDDDGDEVTNIYRWTKNGVSTANLIMPFDTMTNPQAEYSGHAYTYDYSGSSNDGDVFGASWTDAGVVGGAYSLDGSNDFIRIEEQGNSLGGDGSWNDISIEFWVKATTATSTRAQPLLQKQGRPYSTDDVSNPIYQYTGYRVDFSASTTADTITWRVYTENPSDPEAPNQYSVTANIGARANWHHVVCTYTSGVGLKIYADGVAVSNLPGVSGNILETNAATSGSNLGSLVGDWGHTTGGTVGTNKGPLNIEFGGMLDELRIYPTEISAGQVAARYEDTRYGLSTQSTLSKYETQSGEQWRCYVTPNDGLTDGLTLVAGPLTISEVANTAPVASNLAITPASPLTGDDLVANYDYYDADGHPEVGSLIEWYNGGVLSATGAVLASSETAKGESWTFVVTPSDGFDFGDPVGPSAPVIIGNTAPTFAGITITPDPAFEDDALTAIPFGGVDVDDDPLTYGYQWQKLAAGDVWENIIGATTDTLASGNFVAGDTVKVIVTVSDLEDVGNTLEAEKWIVDSAPPTIDSAVLASGSGSNRDDDELTCQAVNPQAPELGERVISVYNWLKGGTSYANLNLPFETNSATTATDYSGYGNDGEVFSATWISDGALGGAYSFDGNDYIRVQEQSNSLGSSGTWSAITVEFWVLMTGTSQESVVSLHDVDYSTGGYQGDPYGIGYSADVRASSNRDRFYWTVYTDEGYATAQFSDYETFGVWRHVVYTYDGVELKIFVDGLEVAATPLTGTILGTSDELLFIGGTGSGADFSGLLDEVKIYPHALSAAQVFQNYADAADSLSDSVTIVPQETSYPQTWTCQVTPNDGWQDGTPELSNDLTLISTNTMPHIDWYSPVTSTPSVYVGESLNFQQVSSDPNGNDLTYAWTVDGGTVIATSQNWTYTPGSASVHTVRVAVSDASETVYHDWLVNVEVAEYTLTVNVVGTGEVTINPDQATYLYGDSVTLTPVVTDPDWKFVGWSGDATGSDDPLVISINGDTSITATFSDENVLTVNVVGGGHVDLDPAGGSYPTDTEVELTAVADPGWTFSGWSGDLTGSTNPDTLVMDDSKSVTATFTEDHYTLTVNVDIGGHVIVEPDLAYYTYGDEVQLTAVADPGFLFESWNGDASGYDETIVIVMDGDKTVSPYFEIAPEHMFADGFESGDFSAWSGTTTTTGGAVSVVTSPVNNGVYSGQFAITTTSTGVRRAYTYINVDNLVEAYGSAYVYIPSGLSLADGQALWLIQFVDAGNAVLAAYGIRGGASGMQWTVQYDGTPYAMGTAFSGSGWYSLDVFFTHAASGPTLVLNLDGVEAASLTYDTSAVNNVASARFGACYYTGENPLTVNVDDATVDAEAPTELYVLTINIVGNGHVDCDPDLLLYLEGTEVELTAVADPGWTFSGWSGAASGTDLTTTVTIGDGDNTVTATFTEAASADELCVVVRGTDNHLYYRVFDGADWTEWGLLPGETYYEPATAYFDGELYICIVGTAYNEIYVGSVDLDTLVFSGWTWLPGASDSTPALAASQG
jgi:uncharacterized repeat protein (TIGR02543 family)